MKSILLALLFAMSHANAAELCLGTLEIQCEEETVTTQLTVSPIPLPSATAISESGHVVRFEVVGPATITTPGDIDGGEIVLVTPTGIVWRQIANRTTLTGTKLMLNSDAFIADVVRVKMSIVDPNGVTSLILNKEFSAVDIVGFEHKNVPFFNPASNETQFSILRLINESFNEGVVIIRGTDDAGMQSGTVEILLPANSATQLNSSELENGSSRLSGSLGMGTGKWRLTVDSDFVGLKVQSLVRNNNTGTISTVSGLVD